MFVVEFLLGSWKIKVGRIEPYLVSYLILDSRSFLLVVLGFHLGGGFFQSLFGLFMDFLHF